ncbi:MAG TPA: serine/threonine-protein kinase [Kiritimatiellia bacterium]|nr:serine/threonine-protein kinase [Kiritimatiellia bacterium]
MQKKPVFDQTTALDPLPGAPGAASGDPGTDASILRDLAPAASPSAGAGSRQLVANYRAILAARAIYYPVAYRFPRELGRGRQGIVFLGLRQGARGCVTRHALKLFDPGIYANAKKYWTDMGRIAAQTSKLQLVKNPALVVPEIYEESNGIGYIQMEVVNGISLRELLDGTHLEQARARSSEEDWRRLTDVVFRLENGRIMIQPGIALYILRQALRGLETLHEMGFVHADVKPANIMIDRLGYVKLIDYGRAMLCDEKMTLLLGTPAYMAPEIHQERVARPRSDLYSLGLVGLEMLRGERLFNADTPLTEADLLQAKRDLPNRLFDMLPDHVRHNAPFLQLLRRLLDPDPANRFASAEEAEVGPAGLAMLHKQLTLAGKDTEYGRELEGYLSRIVNPLGPM